MQPKHNKQLVPLARQLRREMTKENGIYGMIFYGLILSVSHGKKCWEDILLIFTAQMPNW